MSKIMNATPSSVAPTSGLEGIAAADTALSQVLGQAGELVIAGMALQQFVAQQTFDEAVETLWSIAGSELTLNAPDVAQARALAFANIKKLQPVLTGLSPAEGLRLCLSSLSGTDAVAAPILLVSAMPVFAANVARLADGMDLIAPDLETNTAACFLTMLHDRAPSQAEVNALDTYLSTVCDHGMNASTFTARVIASTQADLISAIVGAYGALTGPLHGGAPEPVLDMLDSIGTAENAAHWIEAELARGERLMGFGHRVYRVRDPRADVLASALKELGAEGPRYGLAREVERCALETLQRHKPDRVLETNVEFYTALLLDALHIPRAAFTPVFAVGRVAGWTAHCLEQQRIGRLIRPSAHYIGTSDIGTPVETPRDLSV